MKKGIMGIETKSYDISLEAKRYRCGFSECVWRSEELLLNSCREEEEQEESSLTR